MIEDIMSTILRFSAYLLNGHVDNRVENSQGPRLKVSKN